MVRAAAEVAVCLLVYLMLTAVFVLSVCLPCAILLAMLVG